ncbi:MAG: class I lanthipeptide [Bacteroidales bacterium]|nr:class I lanthipeptide [Bacteroidales bacterium]
MKKKKFNKKLSLNKEKISNLNEIKGGGGKCPDTDPTTSCVVSENHCISEKICFTNFQSCAC